MTDPELVRPQRDLPLFAFLSPLDHIFTHMPFFVWQYFIGVLSKTKPSAGLFLNQYPPLENVLL